jgi:hypothetical protein
MRGRAKAKKSHAISGFNASHSQAAEANDAGAEKRSCVQVVEFWRKLKHKVVARRGILRVTAIDGVSGKDRRVA